jgi:hypothetical protein
MTNQVKIDSDILAILIANYVKKTGNEESDENNKNILEKIGKIISKQTIEYEIKENKSELIKKIILENIGEIILKNSDKIYEYFEKYLERENRIREKIKQKTGFEMMKQKKLLDAMLCESINLENIFTCNVIRSDYDNRVPIKYILYESKIDIPNAINDIILEYACESSRIFFTYENQSNEIPKIKFYDNLCDYNGYMILEEQGDGYKIKYVTLTLNDSLVNRNLSFTFNPKHIKLFNENLNFLEAQYEFMENCKETLYRRFSKNKKKLEKLDEIYSIGDIKNKFSTNPYYGEELNVFEFKEHSLIQKLDQVLRHVNLVSNNTEKINKKQNIFQ